MALTRIENNQISNAVSGNTEVGINGNVKLQEFSVGGSRLANNLNYGSNLTVTGNTVSGNILTGGLISATGSLTGGNIFTAGQVSATGNVTGNYFLGNIACATGYNSNSIYNGTSNVLIATANGNITMSVNGTPNVVVVTSNTLQTNNISTGGNAIIGGDLVVNGNLVYVNVTDLNVEDPIIGLGRGPNNAPLTTDDGKDRGEQLWYYAGSEKSAFTGYDNSAGKILLATDVTITNEIVTVNNLGNLVIGNLEGTSSSVTGTATAGNVLTGGIVSATGTGTFGNVATGGVVSATGTGTFGNVATGGTVSATGTATAGNVLTGGVVSATGTATLGNVLTGGIISAFSNITGGNILFGSGYVSGTGNVYAGNFIGNISGNLSAPGANTDVVFNDNGVANGTAGFTFNKTSNAVTVAGTVSGGNLATAGTVSATGTATLGNVLTGGIISATGTATAGNVLTGGVVSATSTITGGNVLTGGIVSATSTITGGNVNTAGSVSATGSLTGGNIFTGGVVSAVSTVTGGNLATAGTITATGTATLGNVLTGGVVSATSNITGGNVLTGGLVSATGTITSANTITGANLATGGTVSATGTATLGNVLTGGVVSATSTITGGNILTGGLISAFGNITGNYFFGNGSQLTGIDTNLIKNGSSNVRILTANGNISMDVNGTSNVVVVTQNGIDVTGTVSATGNVTGQNLFTGGNVSATGDVLANNVRTSNVISTGALSLTSGANANILIQPNGSGNIILANTYINGLQLTPQQDADAASKYYVDIQVSTGLTVHEAVVAATTSNLATATGGTITYTQPNGVSNGIGATLTTTGSFNLIDSANVQTLGTRILVKNEANAVFNGVYTWANATNLVRSTDADQWGTDSAEALSLNSYFFVTGGNVNLGSAYVVDAPTGVITFGTSNIQFAQFSQAQIYSANTSAGLSLIGQTFSAKVDNNTTAFDGGGNISVKAGANLTTPNIGAATGTSLSATGNITGGNILTGGLVSATGTATAGNVLTGGIISATGTITSANTITGGNINTAGNVSATGTATLGNVLTGGVVSATGTATAGNVLTGGIISATGTATAGNVLTGGVVSATGTITGGNVATGGTVSATGTATLGNVLTGGIISAFSNITGGNVLFGSGQVSGTGNVYAGNFIGNISGNLSAPGANTEVIFNDNNVANATAGFTFNKTSNAVTIAGNITGANVFTGGIVSATGNVTGNYFIGNGSQLTGIDATSIQNGNSNVKVYANGNVAVSVAGSANTVVFTSSGVSATGNVTGNIILGTRAVFGSSFAPTLGATVTINATDSLLVPVGNSVQRPTGVTGMVRFNTTNTVLEVYNGASWVSVGEFTVIVDDQFAGDNSTVTFVLSQAATTDSVIVSINGVVQIPTTAYTVTGTNLTFTEAPQAGDDIDVRILTTTTTVTGISNSPGNASVTVTDTSSVVQVTGDLSVTGSILGGNINSTQITNGNSNVRVVSSGGNVTTSVNGTSNVMVVSSTDVTITGNLTVTGNATLSGNILGDRIQNGTTQIDIQTTGGNANITIGGTSNVAVFATTGAFITGVNSVSGNITGGNVLTGGLISATSTITSAANITGGNVLTGGLISATGNVQAGNIRTAGLISATGNVSGGNLNVTGNIVDTGALSIITGSNGNITLSPNGTGVIIASTDILNGQANGVGNIGNATGYFNTVFAKATSAQYADLAEKYVADAEYEPGTVVMFGGTAEVTVCVNDGCSRVAGVISTNPSYIMNGTLEAAHVATVALTGRVPCRVVGTVRKGDMMVSAGNGLARAEDNPRVGTVIGKALADHDGEAGTIEVVVGRF